MLSRHQLLQNNVQFIFLLWYQALGRLLINDFWIHVLLFGCPVVSDSLWCPGQQHARSPVLHHLLELAYTHIQWVNDGVQPSHSLLFPLFLPSIFPSIRVFSKESALHIRWPQYWSFNFSVSPPSDYSGWISFRIAWFDWWIFEWLNQWISKCSS